MPDGAPMRGPRTRYREVGVQDWVVNVVGELGVLGIALLMFAENLFPPLPSEIIMPLAGYLSTRGEMNVWAAVLAGSAGSLAGALFWYWIGLRLTHGRLRRWVEKHGSWIAMAPEDLDHAVRWFAGHGRYSVLLGRLIPVVRTLISVPAGFARMSVWQFFSLSAAGTVVWTTALTYAGVLLGQQFAGVERYIGLVTWVIIGAAVVGYVRRVARLHRAKRKAAMERP